MTLRLTRPSPPYSHLFYQNRHLLWIILKALLMALLSIVILLSPICQMIFLKADACYFVILLCPTPDDFTCQGRVLPLNGLNTVENIKTACVLVAWSKFSIVMQADKLGKNRFKTLTMYYLHICIKVSTQKVIKLRTEICSNKRAGIS